MNQSSKSSSNVFVDKDDLSTFSFRLNRRLTGSVYWVSISGWSMIVIILTSFIRLEIWLDSAKSGFVSVVFALAPVFLIPFFLQLAFAARVRRLQKNHEIENGLTDAFAMQRKFWIASTITFGFLIVCLSLCGVGILAWPG